MYCTGYIQVSENVVTGAGRLQMQGVIHAVGPQWYTYPDNKKEECLIDLKNTVRNILKKAVRKGFRTVAMPPISSGRFENYFKIN